MRSRGKLLAPSIITGKLLAPTIIIDALRCPKVCAGSGKVPAPSEILGMVLLGALRSMPRYLWDQF
jgi:hypothetical protein